MIAVSPVDSEGSFLQSGEQPWIKHAPSISLSLSPSTIPAENGELFSIIISLTGDPETNQYRLKKTFHSK